MDFKTFSKLIMIEQTLFALPFAYIGILFAGGGTFTTWIWATLALFAARTAGMSFNRVIDARIDAKNPRTQDRQIPKGEVKPYIVWLLAILSCLLLVFSSYMLNTLCYYLSFPAIFLLFSYSFFKRFSSSVHFYLGAVEAAAPMGGYLAATGHFTIVPFILGIVILTWIAGLDIVYSLQDMDFDKKEKLHSIPVKYGRKKAIKISTICYMSCLAALIIAGLLVDMGKPYWISIIGILLIFTYQQILARQNDTPVAVKKFFKANMLISPLLFAGALIDLLAR
ncbi:MAG: putative 4-hydroxybenzoate polyprenyltransferase [Desulfobacterales bacterium]|nr:putative 4-hydroxybenzoate polyprenyltransferase [Desulfobacterales bacterium]